MVNYIKMAAGTTKSRVKFSSLTHGLLQEFNWGDLKLRSYQLEGVDWLLSCYHSGHGCILADEMGLGKTCQIIAMLTVINGGKASKDSHLIVCPLSVLETWGKEIERFSPHLKVCTYIGDKEARSTIAKKIKKGKGPNIDILLTTYEMCLKDSQFLSSMPWDVLVVDEGHRLKNSDSLLYRTLEAWDINIHIILTGTPLQNNLEELYALLSFVHSSQFKLSNKLDFVKKFSAQDQDVKDLHEVLMPFLLRRTKAIVLPDLPEKNDIVLYHGLSALQKSLYKGILTKDIGIFETCSKTSSMALRNILMQLRKCAIHPYLFDGVEPEPFALGEHLVDVSHKLVLVDKLLDFLKAGGHKVLMFSQMTRALDILQDYLGYRGYSYERLDGSVRGEERYLAVQNFSANDETFVFLLSTKAGGQGLNLIAADTVVFIDSDYNPQNDLQAAARVHRIGQERPVKVIRLIGRNTVEEIILARAEEKLGLSDRVIERGDFATPSTKQNLFAQNANQLREILKFGIDELLAEGKQDEPLDFETILGRSEKGRWLATAQKEKTDKDIKPTNNNKQKDTDNEEASPSIYVFEGTDYSKAPSAADLKALEQLIQAEKAVRTSMSEGDNARRTRKPGASSSVLLTLPQRKPRREKTAEEIELSLIKKKERAEKKAKKAEEEAIRKAAISIQKREALWKANGYKSANVELDDEEEEEEEKDQEEDERLSVKFDSDDEESNEAANKQLSINYISGDVTHPVDTLTKNRIIVFCADDSGHWGKGGLFSAISARSLQPETGYELAGRMKDLSLGNCHLIPVDDIESSKEGHDLLALIVAQHRDKRSNKLSGIKMAALEEGLKKVCKVAKEKTASVHLPRIGYDTPGFNWYGTERLIRKHLASQGIPTYIYYFPRRLAAKRTNPTPPTKPAKTAKRDANPPTIKTSATGETERKVLTPSASLPTLFSGVAVYFHNLPEDIKKKLSRFVILTYDGDVEKSMNLSTTHMITDSNSNKLELNDVIKSFQCRVVTPAWLEDCLAKGKLLATEDYLISLT
ncbi:unnamed protein product [Lymnaea stagnalis]|uniref:Chromodomain-helicase-DNA-binding protein 1-like n=1 Tax=Lymnaea stagnalis TaxID=6523 RepID=A0AAV2I3E9_LYMST